MKKGTILLVVAAISLCTMSCSSRISCEDHHDNKLDTTDIKSVAFWSKSEYKKNPCLVTVVDHLWHIPVNEDSLELWTDDCLSAILKYYDTHYTKSIPLEARCDSVINNIIELYMDDCSANIEIIIAYSICSTAYRFQECFYQKALHKPTAYGQRIMAEEEKAWNEFRDLYLETYECIGELKYWGGSIRGTLLEGEYFRLCKSRVEFLRTIANDGIKTSYPASLPLWMTKRDFKDCIKKELHKDPYYEKELEPENVDMYLQCESDGLARLDSLYTSMDRWTNSVKRIGSINRSSFFGEMLDELASQIILNMTVSINDI